MSTTTDNGASAHVPFNEDLCERYLFGEMTEAEQESFETAYFSDDSFFNNFLAVKDEILDLYSRNELDLERRRRMEPHFLATVSRRDRLTESREFINAVTLIAERSADPSSLRDAAGPEPAGLVNAFKNLFMPLRLAAVGGLIVAVGVGWWLLVHRGTSENTVESADNPPSLNETNAGSQAPETAVADDKAQNPGASNDSPHPDERSSEERAVAVNTAPLPPTDARVPAPSPYATPPPSQIARIDPPVVDPLANNTQTDPKPEPAGPRTEFVTLDSATRSATKRNTAEIGTATQNVTIRMVFGGEAYASYSVRISTVGGGTVWRASNLKTVMTAGTKSLAVTVPAGSLSRKDYIVVLEGRSDDGTMETIREYYLHVDRQ